MTQQLQTLTEHHGNQVLHVRGDSDSDLEALFSVPFRSPNDGKIAPNSFKSKNLPASFFQPRPVKSGSTGRDGLSVVHQRSISSPADLPANLTPASTTSQHIKQASVDFTDGLNSLPQGTTFGTNEQMYFLNQKQAIQQWQDPCKSLSPTLGQQQQQQVSPGSQTPHNPNVLVQNLSTLPDGWEQAVTPDGEMYFINHIDKITSWFDPRLPEQAQRPEPMKLSPMQSQLHQQQHTTQHQQQQQQQQATPTQAQILNNPLQPTRRPMASEQCIRQELLKLKLEKERLQREQDEIARKEKMLHQSFAPPVVYKHPSGFPVSGNVTSTGSNSSSRRYQPDMLIKELIKQNSSKSQANELPVSMQTAIQSISTSGVDPFLGQGGNALESHARQNSADSGLGGMGTNYSLPRTPEDFLSHVDEMESHDSGHKLQKQPDFSISDMQGTVNMNMDIGDSNDTPTGMDSDELVPSLQLQEDIGNDLLPDMDVQKIGDIPWL